MTTSPIHGVIVLAGPSGSGKSVCQSQIKDFDPDSFGSCVSTTTRTARAGEVDGVSYHFVTPEEFRKQRDDDQFIETSKTTGHRYGVSKIALQKTLQGGHALMVLDPDGKKSLSRHCKEAGIPMLSVFLSNPVNVRAARLAQRTLDDVQNNKDNPSKILSLTADAGNRFLSLNKEQENWVQPALDKRGDPNAEDYYDIVADSFGAHNDVEVVGEILQKFRALVNAATLAQNSAPAATEPTRTPSSPGSRRPC